MVDAEGEAECGVLHKVDANVQFGKCRKDGLQIVFGNEREILGVDGNEGLVVFEDIKRSFGIDGGEWANDGAFGSGVDERLDVEANVLVLNGFDCFGVDDRSSVVGKFDGFVERYLVDLDGVVEVFWVGVEESRYIFPNGHGLGIHAEREDGCRIVGTFTTKSCGGVGFGASDETLGDDNWLTVGIGLEEGREDGLCLVESEIPVDVTFAIVMVGTDDRAHVNPMTINIERADEVCHDGSGDEFAKRDNLVVVEIVRVWLLANAIVELVEKLFKTSINGVRLVGEKSVDNIAMVLI